MTLAIVVRVGDYCIAGADRLWESHIDGQYACGLHAKLFLANSRPLAIVNTGIGGIGKYVTGDVIEDRLRRIDRQLADSFASDLAAEFLAVTKEARRIPNATVSTIRFFALTYEDGAAQVLECAVTDHVEITKVPGGITPGSDLVGGFLRSKESQLRGDGSTSAVGHAETIASLMGEAIELERSAVGTNQTIGGGIDVAIIDRTNARLAVTESLTDGLDPAGLARGRDFEAWRKRKDVLVMPANVEDEPHGPA